ncbi:MAG: DUF1761 domain-containing protein [Saprospiraceae bacterium]
MEEHGPHFNWLAIAVAAISTLIVGFIYYHPKVMGNAWMKASGMTREQGKSMNMGMTFGISVVLSFLVGVALTVNVQHGGPEFQTFKHGAYHGAMTGVFMAIPIIGVPAMYEMKGWNYILINAGYWILAMALMGGIICAWA